jgi:uncharacterized protein YneF (UPF0154 family)
MNKTVKITWITIGILVLVLGGAYLAMHLIPGMANMHNSTTY